MLGVITALLLIAAATGAAVGPKCPLPGPSRGFTDSGLLLQRTIQDSSEATDQIVEFLNEKRKRETFTSCAPLFVWDQDLAAAAQEWADQCALVEYETAALQASQESRRPNQSGTSSIVPTKLYHDQWLRRSRVIQGKASFAEEPGVAQTVHWARTEDGGLDGGLVTRLLDSEVAIEEGLIDGLFTSLGSRDEDNILSWGHATHVGCGWIQFPTSGSTATPTFENFMVCNYGIGVAANNTCGVKSSAPAYVTYYAAPFDVIADVKKCLKAVRCRRRHRGFSGRSDPCETDVEKCLEAKSGLEFIKGATRRAIGGGVGRSNDDGSPGIYPEASKCKIDTILCGLGSSSNSLEVQMQSNVTVADCKHRIRNCLPLLDVEGVSSRGAGGGLPECECAQELTLADGTVGDCNEDSKRSAAQESPFCFVKRSPCVSVDALGNIQPSVPYEPANGLIHTSHGACLVSNKMSIF